MSIIKGGRIESTMARTVLEKTNETNITIGGDATLTFYMDVYHLYTSINLIGIETNSTNIEIDISWLSKDNDYISPAMTISNIDLSNELRYLIDPITENPLGTKLRVRIRNRTPEPITIEKINSLHYSQGAQGSAISSEVAIAGSILDEENNQVLRVTDVGAKGYDGVTDSFRMKPKEKETKMIYQEELTSDSPQSLVVDLKKYGNTLFKVRSSLVDSESNLVPVTTFFRAGDGRYLIGFDSDGNTVRMDSGEYRKEINFFNDTSWVVLNDLPSFEKILSQSHNELMLYIIPSVSPVSGAISVEMVGEPL